MPLEIEDVWLDWQEDLVEANYRTIGVSGGLGCGKTNVIPKLINEEQDKYPGVRIAVAMPSYEQLDDSLHFEIESYFLKMRLNAVFKKDERRWYFENGSTCEYVSFKVAMEALKGPEYGLGIIDEADNPTITREKFEAFEGRIGRTVDTIGSHRLYVFLNPVSHGHHIYQNLREIGDPNSILFEIPTYANRYHLSPEYIKKRELRNPPGTPGHDRWMMGLCGIPSERAVYKHFKYSRDQIKLEELREAGGLTNFRSAMHLADGQPTGWLQVGFMADGTMVPVREKSFVGDSPDTIAKVIRKIRNPLYMLDMDGYYGVLPKTVNRLKMRESGAILADRRHKAFAMMCQAGLSLAAGRSDFSLGINKGRNRIQKGKLKLLKLDSGLCATPDLLVELEEHQFSESGDLEEEKWSLIRPFEFIAVSTASGIETTTQAQVGLRNVLTSKPTNGGFVDKRRRAF